MRKMSDNQEAVTDVVAKEIPEEGNKTQLVDGEISVDAEYLKTTKIHFAVSSLNGMITENTFLSFVKFSNAARQLGLEWSIETNSVTDPSYNKNVVVAKFLSDKQNTHLMFVDSDITFEPWMVLRLLDRKVDFVSGLVPLKTLPIRWAVNTFEEAEQNGELHEASNITSSFMLTARNVFEKLNAHPNVQKFKQGIEAEKNYVENLRTYFRDAVRQEVLQNDDWTFCENYRLLGGKIWVDKSIMLSQRGNLSFGAQTQDAILQVMGPLYVDLMKSQESATAESTVEEVASSENKV
jgi:hypothetical protein